MVPIDFSRPKSEFRGLPRGLGLLLRFGLVGTLTTLLDLALFNLFSGPQAGFPLVPAHLLASVFTLAASFFGQRNWVFQGCHRGLHQQATRFVMVTVTGVALVQSSVLSGAALALGQAHENWKLLPYVSAEHWVLIRRNGAKAMAMLVGIAWNFLWFRNWVFPAGKPKA